MAFFDSESKRAKGELLAHVTADMELEEREYPFVINPFDFRTKDDFRVALQKLYAEVATKIIEDKRGVAVIHRTLIVLDENNPHEGAKSIRVWLWVAGGENN